MTDITLIVQAAITLAVALCTTFLIPWLKQKVDSGNLQKALDYVTVAVGAAEQMAKLNGWDSNAKKAYVMNYMTSLGLNFDYDTINNMVENAVITLHNELRTDTGE